MLRTKIDKRVRVLSALKHYTTRIEDAEPAQQTKDYCSRTGSSKKDEGTHTDQHIIVRYLRC